MIITSNLFGRQRNNLPNQSGQILHELSNCSLPTISILELQAFAFPVTFFPKRVKIPLGIQSHYPRGSGTQGQIQSHDETTINRPDNHFADFVRVAGGSLILLPVALERGGFLVQSVVDLWRDFRAGI